MLNWLYYMYFAFKRKKFKIIILRKINSLLCIIIRKFANKFVNTYYKFTIRENKIGINTTENRERKVIVSMTTFPGRIDIVWIAIESLLRQSYRPDKIILWLAEEQFEGYSSLPPNLLKQQQRGLDIRFCDDLRSHKKYYYTFMEYPEEIVITVDDDIIYPKNTLETLIKLHKKYPDCICCNRGHLILKNKNGTITSYNNWIQNPTDYTKPSMLLCPTGVSGVLYPPNSVNKEVFNKNSIKELCFFADDLWLKIMSLKNDTRVVKSSSFPGELFTIDSSQNESLASFNVNQNKNDEQLKAILNRYHIDFTD
ncbi:hypothetical protein E1I69_05905 [Bacillus timonensis]|uniref:Glycosyltransferase family 2 protein n=1 Tax=Bacillus timonensis TaxID=1033734 RepID=A0A4S3PW12_9BACI|nr:hypothetical protein [Bacillus timonensis]THE14031.1 hypothetical protein E1I69_05905 [Bacillus timonensis]